MQASAPSCGRAGVTITVASGTLSLGLVREAYAPQLVSLLDSSGVCIFVCVNDCVAVAYGGTSGDRDCWKPPRHVLVQAMITTMPTMLACCVRDELPSTWRCKCTCKQCYAGACIHLVTAPTRVDSAFFASATVCVRLVAYGD